jgi:response regulator RpfG family c-di-GMP phosphodiesterase
MHVHAQDREKAIVVRTIDQPRILCVDDEAPFLQALAEVFQGDFEVHVASNGQQALQKLREVRDLAVVVSDMHMPGMDGATFLHETMKRCPDAARILLTGSAGVDAAKLGVNKAQIFRFLTKPCSVNELRSAVEAGVAHHGLHSTERVVLRETLLGCIRALMSVLAITSPAAFGRANGIKRVALELAARMGFPEFWQLEAAALLSQLGYLTLPPDVADKVYEGRDLTPREQAYVSAAPEIAGKLFEHIPRLEHVLQIISGTALSDKQLAALDEGPIGIAARVLAVAIECDALSSQGRSNDEIVRAIEARSHRYGGKIVRQLAGMLGTSADIDTTQDLELRHVVPGMIINQDVRNAHGILLVPKGFEVTPGFLERMSNFAANLLVQRVQVAHS